jgi:hypothetical protein
MVGVGYGRCWLMVVGIDYQVLIMVIVVGIDYQVLIMVTVVSFSYSDGGMVLVVVMVADVG